MSAEMLSSERVFPSQGAQERVKALADARSELQSERQYAKMTGQPPSETVMRRIIRNLMLGSSNHGR